MADKKENSNSDGIFMLIAAVPMMLLRGWVCQAMWSWFVVPKFHAPTISVGYMIGITMTLSAMVGVWDMAIARNRDHVYQAKDTVIAAATWMMMLGIAAIVHAAIT